MNTYTNAMRPEKEAHGTARKNLFSATAIVAIALALIAVVIFAASGPNQAVVAENNPAVPYSNALELQYARPWLEIQNKPAVGYGNALELQYAQPWLEAQNKPVLAYSNALELQYAQPWLDKTNLPIVVTGYAAGQTPFDCDSSLEILYTCRNDYGQP